MVLYYNRQILDLLKNLYINFLFVGDGNPMGEIKNFGPRTKKEIKLYYPNHVYNKKMLYSLCGQVGINFYKILKDNDFKCRKCFLWLEPFQMKKINPGFNQRYISLMKSGLAEYIDSKLIPEEFISLDRNSIYIYTHLVLEYYNDDKEKYYVIDPTNCMLYPYSLTELLDSKLNYNYLCMESLQFIETTDMIDAATLYYTSKTFWNSVYDYKYLYE